MGTRVFDAEDCRSLALLGMTRIRFCCGGNRQRSFAGRPSRCEGLRFLRMTAGLGVWLTCDTPHLEKREMWGTRFRLWRQGLEENRRKIARLFVVRARSFADYVRSG